MAEKFRLIPDRAEGQFFLGYRSKSDITALPPGALVPGSQNVLTNDSDRVGNRAGYTLDGAENTALTPILSSYEWTTCRGEERPLRFYNGTLEFRYTDGQWYAIKTGLTADAVLQFAEFWNTTEKEDQLLFVDGTANIFEWNGAVATLASVTLNTITKEGSGSWALSGFLTSGTRSVRINGVDYTYTGGETTTTLTGVTPDPTLAGLAVGTLITQTVRTYGLSTAITRAVTMATTQTLDLISTLNNQIRVASRTSRYVWMSKQNNFTDFTAASPRIPGDGDTLTLDGAIVGFDPETNSDADAPTMRISAGKDFWYSVTYKLSADLTNETAVVKRLLTAANQAALSQSAIGKIKNQTVFITNEPTLDQLGRVENITTQQSAPLSDPIKTDFDAYDFTACHVRYWKQFIVIALPAESVVLMYNLQRGYWEAPQILPVQRLAIIGGDLYGHSNAVPETYKLFDGWNDNGNPINAVAAFSYENGGERDAKKNEDKQFSEGYISSNTVLTQTIKYDFGGFTSVVEKDISGNDPRVIFGITADGSLGKNPIGSQPIGSISDSLSGNAKFRVITDLVRQDYYERQVIYSSNEVDYQWEVLAYGSNATLSPATQYEITQ